MTCSYMQVMWDKLTHERLDHMNIPWRTKITVNSKTQVRDEAGLWHTAEKSTEK